MRIDINSRLGVNQFPELLTGTDSINNSIYNIIRCTLSTRGFRPEYGTLLNLWDQIDSVSAQILKVSVIKAIARWEPDIIVSTSASNVIAMPQNAAFQINIYYQYQLTGSNSLASFIFTQ